MKMLKATMKEQQAIINSKLKEIEIVDREIREIPLFPEKCRDCFEEETCELLKRGRTNECRKI